jgi:hypothetical protein
MMLAERVLFLGIMAAATALGAAPNLEPYPTSASKRGLQVQMVDDALALGIQHAGLNCHIASFVDLTGRADSVKFSFEGQDYFFRAGPLAHLDAQIKPLSDRGVLVSLILLNYENRDEALDAIFSPGRKRHLYELFRVADTTEWEKAFAFALPVIEIERWEQLLPQPAAP